MGCAATLPMHAPCDVTAFPHSQYYHPRETRILQVEEVDTCKSLTKEIELQYALQHETKFKHLAELQGEWKRGVSAGGSRNNLEMFAKNPQFLLTVGPLSHFHPNTPEEIFTYDNMEGEGSPSIAKRYQTPVLVSLKQINSTTSLHVAFFVYKAEKRPGRLDAEYFLCVPPLEQTGPFTNSPVVERVCSLTPGSYVVVVAAFLPQHVGRFSLTAASDRPIILQPLQHHHQHSAWGKNEGEKEENTRPDKESMDRYRERMSQVEVQRHADHQSPLGNNYENVNNNITEESGTKGRLLPFLQIDDIDSGMYDHPRNLPPNSCTRPCVRGQTRTCYYRFNFEPYTTMGHACRNCLNNQADCWRRHCVTADGFEKAILTINRRLPAPSIQVCEGDLIVADVKNHMSGRSTTVHWHGIKMKNYKFMDGVPMVTQCPIHESTIFRYTFRAEDYGLHFYHSHDGLQKVDGLVGSLVVRQPRSEDPNSGEYDFDLPSHVIVIQDWYHLMADAMFPGLRFRDSEQMAASYLIQGRGQFIMNDTQPLANTPLATFNVTNGYRYVFRIVAGTCFECQFIFTIENHDFVIIGADAGNTKPYRVDSLTMSPGERYSVVVNANKGGGSFWVGVRTVGLCGHMKAHQVAVLKYRGGPDRPSSQRPNHEESGANRVGVTMSPVNSRCTAETREKDGPCLHDLRSAYVAPPAATLPQPAMRIVWAWGFYFFTEDELFNTDHYHKFLQSPFDPVGSTVNGIINMFPPSPILSQPNDVPRHLLCPPMGFRSSTWNVEHRECVHIIRVPADTVVEIVSVDVASYDANGISHAIHLHGYDMWMIEMGVMEQGMPFNQSFAQLMRYLGSDRRKDIPRDPVTKDTFPLTSGGYGVTRIITDNTGYWFFHCHFAYHLDSGMSGILQVGDASTFPSPPPRFPTCGDYLPVP